MIEGGAVCPAAPHFAHLNDPLRRLRPSSPMGLEQAGLPAKAKH